MNWFKSLRLATQLNFAFVLVALISVLVGVFGIQGTATLNRLMEDSYTNNTMSIIYTDNANTAASNFQRALNGYIVAPDAAGSARFTKNTRATSPARASRLNQGGARPRRDPPPR